MNKVYASLLFAATILSGSASFAQEDEIDPNEHLRISALPYYSYGKGLGMTSPDSLYQLNIRFRMQSRATLFKDEGGDPGIDGKVRRLRLRFDGYVGDPRFQYTIQLAFSPEDMSLNSNMGEVNIVRDAAIYYRPSKNWNFVFGQTKLPGNRQRFNSSGALQLTDRTMNNSSFNIDRDFGFQAHYMNQHPDRFSFNIKAAVSMGEGRNWLDNMDLNLAYTGKLELYPLGAFTNGGEYFEGDLAREQTPKLMLSGAYSFNDDAKRSQGQTGGELYATRDMSSILIDGILKYRGFAFMAAYLSRLSDNPVAYNPVNPTELSYVYAGRGTDLQTSYTFRNNYEVIGRFSTQRVDEDIHPYTPDRNQYTLGVTKYIWEHAFKIQAEFTVEDQFLFDGSDRRNWYTRLQFEIGI